MTITEAAATARPGRRERRRTATREQIFRAALRLFAERGVAASTVEDITEAADVGKGTFFNYFPSKDHVLAAFGEMQLAKVRAVLAVARDGRVPLRETLHRLVHAIAQEPGRSPDLVRSLLTAHLSSEPVRNIMRRNLGRGQRMLAAAIAQAQQRGEIRGDRRPTALARYVHQTYFGTLMMWTLHPSTRLVTWLDAAFDLVWSGIRTAPGQVKREKHR